MFSLLLLALSPEWAAAEEKGVLRLSLAFPEVMSRTALLSLTNDTADTVRVPTPDKGWGPAYLVRDAAGKQIPPDKLFGAPPPPRDSDYLTIAPQTSRIIRSRVAPFHHLEQGVLYTITVKYAVEGGRVFTATFPYGMPVAKFIQPALEPRLALSMEYPDPTFRQLIFVLTNQSGQSVKLLSPAHPGAWTTYLNMKTADEQALTMAQRTVPAITPHDTLTIAPQATARVTVTIPRESYALQAGHLYFITVHDQDGNVLGLFPYGFPPDE